MEGVDGANPTKHNIVYEVRKNFSLAAPHVTSSLFWFQKRLIPVIQQIPVSLFISNMLRRVTADHMKTLH